MVKSKTFDPKKSHNQEDNEALSHAFHGAFNDEGEKNDSETLLWPDVSPPDSVIAC